MKIEDNRGEVRLEFGRLKHGECFRFVDGKKVYIKTLDTVHSISRATDAFGGLSRNCLSNCEVIPMPNVKLVIDD